MKVLSPALLLRRSKKDLVFGRLRHILEMLPPFAPTEHLLNGLSFCVVLRILRFCLHVRALWFY